MHWPNFARVSIYSVVTILSALALVPYFRLKSTISHLNESPPVPHAFALAGIVAGLWTGILFPTLYILSFFVRKTTFAFIVEFVCLAITWVIWVIAMGMTATESRTISAMCASPFDPVHGDTGDVCSWVHLTEKLAIIIFVLLSIYLVIFYFVARINAGSTLQDPLPAVDEERVLQGTNPVLPAPSYSPGLRVTHASMKDLDDKPPLYSAEG